MYHDQNSPAVRENHIFLKFSMAPILDSNVRKKCFKIKNKKHPLSCSLSLTHRNFCLKHKLSQALALSPTYILYTHISLSLSQTCKLSLTHSFLSLTTTHKLSLRVAGSLTIFLSLTHTHKLSKTHSLAPSQNHSLTNSHSQTSCNILSQYALSGKKNQHSH